MILTKKTDSTKDPQLLIVPFFERDIEDNVIEQLKSTFDLKDFPPFEAKKDQSLTLIPGVKSKYSNVFIIGLGVEKSFIEISKKFSYCAKQWKASKYQTFAVDLDHLAFPDQNIVLKALINGFYCGYYDIGKFKNSLKEDVSIEDVELAISPSMDEAIDTGKVITELSACQSNIKDLMNGPSNLVTPEYVKDYITLSGKKYGFEVNVFDVTQIKSDGMNLLAAVSQGSHVNPYFVIMRYNGNPEEPLTGLVGKGVTFDTGGVSIKPSDNMHYMKSDMGGAAAVIGAVEVAARLKLPVNLVAAVPLTENCVDGKAIKPGDVFTSYSGKSVEIIDTDAEGRLILADAMAYIIKNYHPKTLVDLATLTGSCVRTLGYHAAGIFSNNNQLVQEFCTAGEKTGEKSWPLPLWNDYDEDLKSDVADIKNLSGKPVAGAINAAKFLEAFTEDHERWVHFDIAGTAFADSNLTNMKSATAYGVLLLSQYLSKHTII